MKKNVVDKKVKMHNKNNEFVDIEKKILLIFLFIFVLFYLDVNSKGKRIIIVSLIILFY